MWTNSNPTHVTTATRRRILARDGAICADCGNTDGPHDIDHIDNKRGAGYNDDANLQVLCRQCHKTKTARESAHARRQRSQRAKMTIQPHPGLLAN